MFITSARLQNYRSYSDSAFEFEPGVNIIVGPNASGKTNLLDALYFITQGSPIRPGREYIIKEHADWARIDGLTSENQERIIKVQNNKSPEVLIDDRRFVRLPRDRRLPVVLFEPTHLYFITTSPELRRNLIDDIIEKTDAEFTSIKNQYTRSLRQRNTLLKRAPHDIKSQIFAWDVRLSELAGTYVKKRAETIAQINTHSSRIYSNIASNEHELLLEYDTKLSVATYASSLLSKLQDNLELDQLRGFTGSGPHRDDIAIKIDGKDMRDVASRGETRSILLTLKIIESNLLEAVTGVKPLLLLDDVFGELDGSRRKSLVEFMAGSQTFITTTDADVIGHSFAQKANIIYTENSD